MKIVTPIRTCVLATLVVLGALTMPGAASSVAASEAEDSCTDIEPSATVAYYFHGNMRCATCKKIEAYSEVIYTPPPDPSPLTLKLAS